MNMVERVARAIYENEWGQSIKWVYAGRHVQERAMLQARTAIAVMREPSEAMIAAGGWHVAEVDSGDEDSLSWRAPSEAGREVWQAMIDAALAEGGGK